MAVEAILQKIGIYSAGENMEDHQFRAVRFNMFNRWQKAGENEVQGILTNTPRSGVVCSVVVFGLSKARLGGTVTAGRALTSDANGNFIEGDGIAIAMDSGVVGDIISVFISAGGSASTNTPTPGGDGFIPWHIVDTETITVPDKREMAIHGELRLEGSLILTGSARLRIED